MLASLSIFFSFYFEKPAINPLMLLSLPLGIFPFAFGNAVVYITLSIIFYGVAILLLYLIAKHYSKWWVITFVLLFVITAGRCVAQLRGF